MTTRVSAYRPCTHHPRTLASALGLSDHHDWHSLLADVIDLRIRAGDLAWVSDVGTDPAPGTQVVHAAGDVGRVRESTATQPVRAGWVRVTWEHLTHISTNGELVPVRHLRHALP